MTVCEYINILQKFPQDMEIVVVGDYVKEPDTYIEKYTNGNRDEEDNLIIKERLEIH